MFREIVKLTLLVVAHGRPDLLARLIDSLCACSLPGCYDGLVVVENGERLGVEKVVSSAPSSINARYVFESSRSKTVALNSGLTCIDDGLVVFFDDDVRLHENTLLEYSDAAARYGRGFFFGGRTGVDQECAPASWLTNYLPASAQGFTCAVIDSPLRTTSFLGFNWAAFTSDIKAAGGFNTRIGPGRRIAGGDETLMQYHLLQIGCMGIFLDKAMVWHWVPPERSSPEWVLRRTTSVGFMAGSLAAHELPHDSGMLRYITLLPNCFRRQLRRGSRTDIIRLTKTGRWSLVYAVRYTIAFAYGFSSELFRPLFKSRSQSQGA